MNTSTSPHRRLLRLSALLGLLSLGGCYDDVHDHPELTSGKQLFDYHCAGCHHSAGNGNFLEGIPANRNSGLSPAQIAHTIRGSDKGERRMPRFPNMGQQEASKIAAYLKQL